MCKVVHFAKQQAILGRSSAFLRPGFHARRPDLTIMRLASTSLLMFAMTGALSALLEPANDKAMQPPATTLRARQARRRLRADDGAVAVRRAAQRGRGAHRAEGHAARGAAAMLTVATTALAAAVTPTLATHC